MRPTNVPQNEVKHEEINSPGNHSNQPLIWEVIKDDKYIRIFDDLIHLPQLFTCNNLQHHCKGL